MNTINVSLGLENNVQHLMFVTNNILGCRRVID